MIFITELSYFQKQINPCMKCAASTGREVGADVRDGYTLHRVHVTQCRYNRNARFECTSLLLFLHSLLVNNTTSYCFHKCSPILCSYLKLTYRICFCLMPLSVSTEHYFKFKITQPQLPTIQGGPKEGVQSYIHHY